MHFGLFLNAKVSFFLFSAVSGTLRTPGCNDKDFGNVHLHGVHHRDGGWCSWWIRNEYVRGSILSSGPVLRRKRQPQTVHPRFCELRVRKGRARLQHLRHSGVAVLRGDREGRGKIEGLQHLRRHGPQEVASTRVPNRPQQPSQPHLLAVGELRAIPAECDSDAVSGEEVRGDLREPPVLFSSP